MTGSGVLDDVDGSGVIDENDDDNGDDCNGRQL